MPAFERALGVYLHIPFCAQKCAYCHFSIDPGRPAEARRDRYLRALTTEIGGSKGGEADSMYFGGGTPSLVPPEQIAAIVNAVAERYTLASDTEVTIEVNPKDLDERGYAALLAAGVNRVSLGLQSFDDEVLREMFRDHGAEDSVRAFRAARAAGVANLSADLILGWPGETRGRFLAGLHRLLDLGPDHVSLYVLEIDGKTVVAHHARAGTLHLPDDDLVADLFNEAEDLMAAAGIAAYEISNFARPGFESRHNLKYWDDGPFHAFGQSAHGFDQGVRYWNEATFGSYCAAIEAKGSARAGERVLSPRERLEEAVMTGLRVRRGIDRATFRVRHGIDVMEAFGEALGPSLKAELLVADETAVRLTRRGVLMSSEVLSAVI
ncbi:MAG: radical SAM family heme chaperone HemW [Vicinamibacteria bacterium]|nr:radical SAM family heme chaperone HemW [Vicinamibacteria bacterium]MBP9947681.1 radical SAM family heme chaperone HemW [Vicinamibacteria bacterium]